MVGQEGNFSPQAQTEGGAEPPPTTGAGLAGAGDVGLVASASGAPEGERIFPIPAILSLLGVKRQNAGANDLARHGVSTGWSSTGQMRRQHNLPPSRVEIHRVRRRRIWRIFPEGWWKKVALLALYPWQEEDEDDENSPWREQFRTDAQAAQPAPSWAKIQRVRRMWICRIFPEGWWKKSPCWLCTRGRMKMRTRIARGGTRQPQLACTRGPGRMKTRTRTARGGRRTELLSALFL